MPEHIRITRNRREFLTDAFCGFGSIAMADLLMRSAARAAELFESARAKSSIHAG